MVFSYSSDQTNHRDNNPPTPSVATQSPWRRPVNRIRPTAPTAAAAAGAGQHEQGAYQGVLQPAREYRNELGNTLGVVAHRIGNADPSPDEVHRKDEQENPQNGHDVRFRLWLRHFLRPVLSVQPRRAADGHRTTACNRGTGRLPCSPESTPNSG